MHHGLPHAPLHHASALRPGHWSRIAWLLLLGSPCIPAAPLESTVVGVVLNAVEVSNGEIIYSDPNAPQRGAWIKLSSLAEWRLRADPGPSRLFEGVAYGLVCSVPTPPSADTAPSVNLRCIYDESTALLTLSADDTRIVPLRVEALRLQRAAPSDPGALGGYVNYDLFGVEGVTRLRGMAAEGHVFSGWGNGYLNLALLNADGRTRTVASFAGWQWDMPERGTSLAVGGVVGEADPLRPTVPLLGLRYGTNIGLQPDALRVQRPWASGTVERASRTDLFVDGLFRRSSEVPYGPYTFEADALLSGLGQLQLVQTDQRGEQTVRNVSYYFAPQLLPTGLLDYSAQAGILGPNTSRLSATGDPVASIGLRRGMSAQHTLSLNAILGKRAGLLGSSSDLLLGDRGVLRAGLSVFDRGDGLRARWMLGHEFQSRSFSSVLRLEATPGETQQNLATTARPPSHAAQALLPIDRRIGLAGVSWNVAERMQASVSIASQANLYSGRSTVWGVFGTYRHSNTSQITAGVQQLRQVRSNVSVQINWLLQLEPRHLTLASLLHTPERSSLNWTVQSLNSNLEEDNNAGQYRVFGEVGQAASVGATYQKDERFGRWRTEAQTQGRDTTLRAGLTGAVGWMQGSGFAARRIDNSFILVDTDGQADVPVFFENRYAGRTNPDGKLLLPDARAYQRNQVSIDASSLPIEYTITQDQLLVVPRSQAGVNARFDISDGGILIKVRSSTGTPLPVGARAAVSSQSLATVVGSRSEIFINRAKLPARIEVSWPDGNCRFDYQPESDTDPAADGVFTCQ